MGGAWGQTGVHGAVTALGYLPLVPIPLPVASDLHRPPLQRGGEEEEESVLFQQGARSPLFSSCLNLRSSPHPQKRGGERPHPLTDADAEVHGGKVSASRSQNLSIVEPGLKPAPSVSC